jgi:hypothetical protein
MLIKDEVALRPLVFFFFFLSFLFLGKSSDGAKGNGEFGARYTDGSRLGAGLLGIGIGDQGTPGVWGLAFVAIIQPYVSAPFVMYV